MSKHIQIAVSERVQTVRINRPDKKNALDLAMYGVLTGAIRTADADRKIRVTLLTGTADSFCSGNDIQDFLRQPPTDESSPVLQFVNALIQAEKPLVAAVNGLAIGIGTTMLLHCDLAFAAESARFQMPFVSIGLCPEAGSTFLLPALMGHARAAELLLTGRMFGAREARELGIVHAVEADAGLEDAAQKAAARLAMQPPGAVKVTKGLLRQSLHDRVAEAAKRESANFIPMLDAPEAREALSAFMEKRKPDFSGF